MRRQKGFCERLEKKPSGWVNPTSAWLRVQALEKQGKLTEAERLYQSSRSMLDRLPKDSPLLPLILTHQASILRKLKKDDAAAKVDLRIRQLSEQKKPSE